ncbi:regulatory protein RecX [Mariprofundus sp. NF]|uniref:regulatory protein RecX n=1 Tax=Mariprofundus sp. NF TaxID=2608716 RepID=UPI0015A19EF9|nr:regulatory protein RecX [Mariprofundus sp. NF]NWF39841.1 regulatory protein RecX [Mariprofundus sp. NF]
MRLQALNKEELAAYTYAVRLLSQREFNTREMADRLANRDYDAEIVTEVIRQLKSDNYLSEQRYAEAFLRSRLKRGEAPWLAAQKAKQKGAESSALQAALAEISEAYDDEQVCCELLDQRDPGGLRFDDERVWQRQARFLRNKGHNSATILRVLKQR